ncbi:MAG: TIM barrel protein [Albidovulum sp.]|nr:TIM barrel protein [Albidovulum sp.]
MKLSLASWSLPLCTLQEAAAISKALGIGALDVGLFYRSALNKAEILADPRAAAERVKTLGIAIPNYYHLFGEGLDGRNLASPRDRGANCGDFEKVMEFCDVAGIPTVFVLPGIVNPGQSRDDAFRESAESLGALYEISHGYGTSMTIEAHVHSLLESPADVRRMLDAVPGLKLTLDYAHFVCLGYRQEEIDPLAAEATHMHLRQARPGVLQAKSTQGTINMAAQFGRLKQVEYSGYMALEYVHQDYMNTLFDDVLSETIALRDTFWYWSNAGRRD